MKTFKGLWILLAVVLGSSVAFGNVSIPATFAPQQAVVNTVLLVIDGTPVPAPNRSAATAASNEPRRVASAEQNRASAAVTDAETARLAQYVALHKGQLIPR